MDQLRLPDDPHGGQEAHDVLAADEFAIPAHGDYGLHLPRDPHGIEEAHDVLAADEFAIPSGPDRSTGMMRGGDRVNPLLVLLAAAVATLLYRALRR
jgi:hypothetical protein